MTSLIIATTGINASENPGPGMGVARCLREAESLRNLDLQLFGLAYDAMEPGIYMDWLLDAAMLLPYPANGGRAWIKRILQIKETHGLDLLLPNLDVELPLCIRYQDLLAQHDVRVFMPSMEQFRLRGKDHLEELARGIGLATPQTLMVSSHSELDAALEHISLPAMIKGVYYKAHLARTFQEAHGCFEELAAVWGVPVLVQQLATGEELNLIGLGDGDGGLLGAMTVKKISLTSLGKIWTGVTVRNEPMLSAAQRFVQETGWRGPFELECMVTSDAVQLLEINPRFPAWVYLAAGAGLNLPERLVHKAMALADEEQLQQPPPYAPGRLFVRYTYEMVVDMQQMQAMATRGETS